MNISKIFAYNLRDLRRKRGWTQVRLAQEASISFNFISQLERSSKVPTLRTVAKLAEALEIHPLDLLQPPPEEGAELGPCVQLLHRMDKKQIRLAQAFLKVIAKQKL